MTDPRSTLHSFTLLFTGLVLAACGSPADSTGGSTDPSSSSATTGTPEPTTADASSTAADGSSSTADAGSSSDGGDPGQAQCQADKQDCPDDFKCVLRRGAADWEFVCLPVQGDNTVGDPCNHDGVITGTDDCDQSSWCIGAFDTTGSPWQGLCYPLCVGMTCEAEQRCVGIGALPVCAPICDPLVGGDCGSDEACIYRPPEGFVCFPTGTDGAAIGEPCETAVSCDAGLHCAQKVAGCAPEDFCCTDYCDTGNATNTCAQQDAGATCASIGATDPTQAHVGACVVQD